MLRVAVPFRTYISCSLLGLACGVVASAGVTRPAKPASPVPAPDIAVDEAIALDEAQPANEAAPPAPSSELLFVFHAGGTHYVALDTLDRDHLPRHGKARHVVDDYVDSAVASIADRDLPSTARAWRGRTLNIEGNCVATISHFAVIGRIVGDPSWADGAEKWTSDAVFKSGSVVLAAQLDDGCTGTYARDAASAKVIAFDDVKDPPYEAAARAALTSSSLGREADVEWATFEKETTWANEDNLVTRAVRDPRSGTTWISVHGHVDFTCGGPDINLWGLYRVERDGTLTNVQLRKLDDMVGIDALVDTNGDGTPELLGHSWLGPSEMLVDAAGTELGRLDLPFLGCPC